MYLWTVKYKTYDYALGHRAESFSSELTRVTPEEGMTKLKALASVCKDLNEELEITEVVREKIEA